jgi:ketosteroid isomerase-like protein
MRPSRPTPRVGPPERYRARLTDRVLNELVDSDTSSTSANKMVVQQFWDALAARDWKAMKSLLTEDAHYTDVGTPGPGGTGPEGVIARLKIGLEPLDGYIHLPGAHMIGEGDLVMTEHTERWTFHTGEVIDHSFVSVTALRDGRICRWHDYSNIPNITDNAPAWWLERISNAARAGGMGAQGGPG